MQKDLKYWLALNKIPKLGPVSIKKLWEHFGSIEKVWQADEAAISQIEGLSKPAVQSFLDHRPTINLDEELAKIAKSNIKAVALEDPAYPQLLKNIYDPPPVI